VKGLVESSDSRELEALFDKLKALVSSLTRPTVRKPPTPFRCRHTSDGDVSRRTTIPTAWRNRLRRPV
jgi:hypothetical protein